MIFLYILLGVLIYAAGIAFTAGYMERDLGDEATPAAIFWPVVLVVFLVGSMLMPVYEFGLRKGGGK
jgi:uncharacterized membrane protein